MPNTILSAEGGAPNMLVVAGIAYGHELREAVGRPGGLNLGDARLAEEAMILGAMFAKGQLNAADLAKEIRKLCK